MYLTKLKEILNKKSRKSIIFLIFFSIFVSAIEVVGISAIMPFIDIATNFSNIQSNFYYRYVFNLFSFEKEVNFVIIFGLFLLGFYIFRVVIVSLYHYRLAIFSKILFSKITQDLFNGYLKMPYQKYVEKNSSFLTKAITSEANLLTTTLNHALLMISELFVIFLLYVLMLFANWKITLIFTIVALLKILILTKTVSKKIKSVGQKRAISQANLYEILNRTFGNFKHIKLQHTTGRESLENEFSQSVNEYAHALAINSSLAVVPRLFIETIGFGLILLLLIFLLFDGQKEILYFLPTLSFFVLAMYRLLPSINRIITSFNVLMYHHKAIDIIETELKTEQEDLTNESITFTQNIRMLNVGFSFKETSVLSKIDLEIKKGDKVAFIGESGAGKSTLVDLIIGLNEPKEGKILVDGILLNRNNLQHWRSKIGYIPQQVYLFDGTVAENVCFGKKLDENHLLKVLKQANILDFLETKQGIHTLVGEGGIQLSGGQKQRIAIARALYGNPDILVLDEATSALDYRTEKRIMDEIYQIASDKTLIIIAHRLSTIKGCNEIYELENGVINAK